MLIKNRSESHELLKMRSLNMRMKLSEKEKGYYTNLEKGYEGEKKFDLLTEILQEERYIINDLLLEVNNSYFQIDTLIISQEGIQLLDVKNFQDDCYLESGKLYSVKTGKEYKNPLDQLKRSMTLFNQLLQAHKQHFIVEASVIFINPEFTLYQAPRDQSFILPTQINRFLSTLNKTPSKLDDTHKKLAQMLLSFHQTKNPYTLVPDYHYDQLQKGIYCRACKSFLISRKNNDFICQTCGENEKLRLTILRNIKEFELLFPERKITTQNIYEWCKTDISKRTIRRILMDNYTPYGYNNHTYFK